MHVLHPSQANPKVDITVVAYQVSQDLTDRKIRTQCSKELSIS